MLLFFFLSLFFFSVFFAAVSFYLIPLSGLRYFVSLRTGTFKRGTDFLKARASVGFIVLL